MIRLPLPSDQPYIAATWARSMLSGLRAGHAIRRHGSRRQLPSERDVRKQIGSQIDAVMDRSDSRALVCASDEEPNLIIGWIVYVDGPSVPVVHYAYCREPFRGTGVASALFRRIGVDRHRAVVCTSSGPSSHDMRTAYKASVHVPLQEFLR